MASIVAKATTSSYSSQIFPLTSSQEKGSRNKRKFRADPPLGDPIKGMPTAQNECMGYEFSAEKFGASPVHGQSSACDLCGVNQDHSDELKLDLGLASVIVASEVGPSQSRERLELEKSHDADWSDLTESELEGLVLSNLDAIYKSAIKKIVACGYTEDIATKAVLRSGLCWGRKDTVSNIVDNTLAFLRNGQEIDPLREHCFEDLQQLEKYILAELVCVIREVRPFFSTGDVMWGLLISDMNASHACAMDGDSLNSLPADKTRSGTSSVSSQSEEKTDVKCSDLNPPSPCISVSSVPSGCSLQSVANNDDASALTAVKQMNANSASRRVSEKEGLNSVVETVDKPFSGAGASQSHVLDEKFLVSRKVFSGSAKRECLLRQKSLHLEKNSRMHGSKGSRKLSGFGGFILDKKLRSVSESTSVSIKNASLRLSKAMGVDMPQDIVCQSPVKPEPCPPASVTSDSLKGASSISKAGMRSAATFTNTLALPTTISPPGLSSADTELSLSLLTRSNSTSVPASCTPEVPNSSFPGINYDKSLVPLYPQDSKDECIVRLLPRVRELQNQLQEWTEWANQKVMQAARRLGKDKTELKSLRQEKEEVERLKKEKQTLEENTMKKFTEMENALCKASGQVQGANSAVRKLQVENAALRQEMEAAKLRAAESAASCQEASKREKKTLMKFQSWEKQKTLLQEELVREKRKVHHLLQEVEVANQLQEQQEARWRQEEKAKDEMLFQASSLKKEREDLEASTKSKEDIIKLKAETNLQKYKDDIQKLEREISQLRLKTDSSKIAALRQGIDGSYAGGLVDGKTDAGQKVSSWTKYISELANDLHDLSDKGVKRERECVMCLSEEMSVVFLPCAHQVVCITCNELHEKQGMKDCPSCRGPIHRRIPVRYARS